ncbi:hypothetical protein QJQ45_008231 [Haematococcus lacustris]|nr:hypothetical protein QJQ45_008231 [Haematococcus lacustris]
MGMHTYPPTCPALHVQMTFPPALPGCAAWLAFHHESRQELVQSGAVVHEELHPHPHSSGSYLGPGCPAARRPQHVTKCQPSQTWTKTELEQMTAEVHNEEDEKLGEAWRATFEDNPASLYDYVTEVVHEDQLLRQELLAIPKDDWPELEVAERLNRFPPAAANEFLGMGTWRLKGDVEACIEFLVGRLEGAWREVFEHDLNSYPADKWKGKYDICDSMDPEYELKGWSYSDIPNPEKGQEGYPRLLLENRVYCSRVFRKLHLEVGTRQDGLDVLHVVLYPRYAYDLPILAMDLVLVKGVASLAIVDACPVRAGQELPSYYLETMYDLQAEFLPGAENRSIPEWGSRIFSPACVCLRPDSKQQLVGFMKYALALHRAHLDLAQRLEPLPADSPSGIRRRAEVLSAHKAFVDNQLANKKTSRVLEAAFGAAWTERYMTDLMFDFCPGQEPAFEDSSLAQLYDYFHQRPEYGSLGKQMMARQVGPGPGPGLGGVGLKGVPRTEADLARAEEVLEDLAQGYDVREVKVVEALQTLYESDEDFQENCLALVPELSRLDSTYDIARILAGQLDALGLRGVRGWAN